MMKMIKKVFDNDDYYLFDIEGEKIQVLYTRGNHFVYLKDYEKVIKQLKELQKKNI